MKTEKAYIIENPEPPTDGVVVGHIYRPDDDPRRHTDFYLCGTLNSAKNLVKRLQQIND